MRLCIPKVSGSDQDLRSGLWNLLHIQMNLGKKNEEMCGQAKRNLNRLGNQTTRWQGQFILEDKIISVGGRG